MQLTALIREDLVTVDLEARDKWEAIEELVDLLISRHELRLSDRDEVVDAVVAREKSLSTGLEHGLAIPHGVVGCVTDTLSALGVCKEGVPFDAIDGQRVKLVILLLIPEGAFQRHVRTLAGIARLGSTPELRNRIFAAQTPADVLSVLRQADYEDYSPIPTGGKAMVPESKVNIDCRQGEVVQRLSPDFRRKCKSIIKPSLSARGVKALYPHATSLKIRSSFAPAR